MSCTNPGRKFLQDSARWQCCGTEGTCDASRTRPSSRLPLQTNGVLEVAPLQNGHLAQWNSTAQKEPWDGIRVYTYCYFDPGLCSVYELVGLYASGLKLRFFVLASVLTNSLPYETSPIWIYIRNSFTSLCSDFDKFPVWTAPKISSTILGGATYDQRRAFSPRSILETSADRQVRWF
jgi:hypothetical protein